MSRKDYIAFAEIVRRNLSILSVEAARRIASQMADEFAKDNANFDRARFMTACGVN